MSELTAAVDASETLWTVDEVPDPEFGFYTVGSEIVQVIAGFPGGDPGYAVGQTFPAKIRVIRATNGTTAATHADGVALTAANAFSAGGGGVTVDNTVDPPAEVTTLVAPGAVIAGAEATLGTVLLRVEEVVVAFDDDLSAGVPMVTLAAGEQLFSVTAFVESAITATADDFILAAYAGAELASGGVNPNPSYQTFSATIGQAPLVVLAVRATAIVVKETVASSGTWTAGSLRFVALVGSVA